MANFKNCQHLIYVSLHSNAVSDAGLVHWKDFQNLTVLVLLKTKVTAAGIDDLKKTLPGCKIEWDGGVLEPSVATE